MKERDRESGENGEGRMVHEKRFERLRRVKKGRRRRQVIGK